MRNEAIALGIGTSAIFGSGASATQSQSGQGTGPAHDQFNISKDSKLILFGVAWGVK